MNRRTALKTLTATAAAGVGAATALAQDAAPFRITNGRIKQSVVPWCFNPMPVEELAKHAAAMGLKSVELCDPKHWPMLKELGLTVRDRRQPRLCEGLRPQGGMGRVPQDSA
jgi:hydroxypyruvate isomerase